MIPADKKAKIEHVLNGEIRPQDDNLFKEYADYINKIRRGEMFPDLSDTERKKVELLVKSSFLGVVNAWYTPMPLDIYGTGIYSEANKGKEMVKGQDSTRNQNLGLMKGHMPLALDDIARSDKEIHLLSGKKGYGRKRNKKKDHYESISIIEAAQDWKYCIEGCDIDGHALRVIVTFTEDLMPIITVIRI